MTNHSILLNSVIIKHAVISVAQRVCESFS